MNDPHNPLGWPVWRRAARLGLIWAVLFFAATGALYGLLGPLGWTTAARAICAALAGPLLASAAIGAWWLMRRPVFSETGRSAPHAQGEGDVEPDGRGNAPTL